MSSPSLAKVWAMLAEDESARLIERFRGGDQQAAEELFSRYVNRLVALANKRMSTRLARRVDPEDVVQSVYRSFFSHARDGKFTFDQSGDLWKLLVVITLNKIRQKVEFHSAQKRKMDREQTTNDSDMYGVNPEAVAREPSHVETLAVLEEIDQLTKGLTEVQKRIVGLRLQGYRIEEIADDVSRSERTVRRVMDQVKTRLEQRLAESARTD